MITRSCSSKSRPSAPQPHRGHLVTSALILVLTAIPLAAQRPAPAQRAESRAPTRRNSSSVRSRAPILRSASGVRRGSAAHPVRAQRHRPLCRDQADD